MKYDEAKLYLEHTSYDDFNLEEHQINNRLQAIKVVLEENEELKADYGTKAQVERDLLLEENNELKSELELYRNGVYYSSKIDKLEQENQQLKDNWNELKKWLIENWQRAWSEESRAFDFVLDKMKELEEGKSE